MIEIDESIRIVSDSDTWIVQEKKSVQDENSKNFGKEMCKIEGITQDLIKRSRKYTI